MHTAQTTVGTGATMIVATAMNRRGLLITNMATGGTLYVGSASVTTATGFPVAASSTIDLTGIPVAGIYGVSTSSVNHVASIEW